ncbi:MAG: T9SS type A sorting domain-containing protein, partial [Flavobacterium sp.]|nr:T9SS type A sorting domain-containing protein [Flavobacterium sp.]
SVKVYDMQGRLVEKANTDKVGSRLAAGAYNIIVNQGANTKSVRVIKN